MLGNNYVSYLADKNRIIKFTTFVAQYMGCCAPVFETRDQICVSTIVGIKTVVTHVFQ